MHPVGYQSIAPFKAGRSERPWLCGNLFSGRLFQTSFANRLGFDLPKQILRWLHFARATSLVQLGEELSLDYLVKQCSQFMSTLLCWLPILECGLFAGPQNIVIIGREEIGTLIARIFNFLQRSRPDINRQSLCILLMVTIWTLGYFTYGSKHWPNGLCISCLQIVRFAMCGILSLLHQKILWLTECHIHWQLLAVTRTVTFSQIRATP